MPTIPFWTTRLRKVIESGMPGFHIASYSGDNWKIIKDLRLEALRSDHGAFAETIDDAKKHDDQYWQDWSREFQKPNGPRMFLAKNEAGNFGFVYGLNGSISNEFRLAGLWVRASMRRSGAGNALILSVVDWAKKQISGAEIHLWSTDGILASYYEKLGFKLTTNTKPFGVQNERTLVEMVWRT